MFEGTTTHYVFTMPHHPLNGCLPVCEYMVDGVTYTIQFGDHLTVDVEVQHV